MKKLLYLLLFPAVMAGCSKDEETPAEKIIGTWELIDCRVDTTNNAIDLNIAANYEKINIHNKICESVHNALHIDVSETEQDSICYATHGSYVLTCSEHKIEQSSSHFFISHTYSIDDRNIHLLGYYNFVYDWGFPIYFILGIDMEYKINNNELIIGFKSSYYNEVSCVYYCYYVRK